MTEIWNSSKWHAIYWASEFEKENFGVYQIRIVDKDNKPIPIPRIGGTDPDGVIYIGRSGYRSQKTNRSLAKRISEFERGLHSGEGTYYLLKAYCKFFRTDPYKDHQLQYRVGRVAGTKEKVYETEIYSLATYFAQYGELPPCNSKFDRKWDRFEPALKGVSIYKKPT